MQRATCKVRLAGDLGNEVQKLNVSPAEIAILRDLHGGYDSVKDIQPTSMDKSPHADERRRLASIYGQHVVDRIFPGQYNPLPVTLKDIEPKPSLDEEAANADSKRVTATVPMDPGNAIIPPTVPVNAMGPKQPTMNTVAPPGGLFHQDPPAEKAPPQGAVPVVADDPDALSGSDQILVDTIGRATTMSQLQTIAKNNEVAWTGRTPQTVDAMKKYLLKEIFPNKQW